MTLYTIGGGRFLGETFSFLIFDSGIIVITVDVDRALVFEPLTGSGTKGTDSTGGRSSSQVVLPDGGLGDGDGLAEEELVSESEESEEVEGDGGSSSVVVVDTWADVLFRAVLVLVNFGRAGDTFSTCERNF